MMRLHTYLSGALTALVLLAAAQASAQSATAELINADGEKIGTVELNQLAQGVHIFAQAEKLPAGVHAFHIHAVGKCEPPFKSAGGHFNPTGAKHGWNSSEGPHAGDLPNVHVQDDGVLAIEYFTAAVTLGEGETSLFDEDGSAIVMHEGADDYQSDPAGAAGPRIACGVIMQSE